MTVFTERRSPKTNRKLSRINRKHSGIYLEGMVAGLLGAAAVALWFLLVDILQGRPLYTPNMLGRALFWGEASGIAASAPVSYQMVFMFTWIHALVFVVIGAIAAWLIQLAGRSPNYGFGILLLLVLVGFEFTAFSMGFAWEVMYALTIPLILVGNLLAAAVMGYYFWRNHRKLKIHP